MYKRLDFEALFNKKNESMKLDLKAIHQAYDRLKPLLTKVPTILIGGTNGKGTTSGLLCRLFSTLDIPVGLFSSPHIISFEERFFCSHENITEDDLIISLKEMQNFIGEIYDRLSFFEVATLLALVIFSKKNTAINILEVGLGGRLDATNIVDPIASVIVSLGLDHQNILGESLAEIAYEKIHIGRKGRPLFLGSGFSEYRSCDKIEKTLVKLQEKIGFNVINSSENVSVSGNKIFLQISENKKMELFLPKKIMSLPNIIQNNFSLALLIFSWVLDNYLDSFSSLKRIGAIELVRNASYLFDQKGYSWPSTLVARFQKVSLPINSQNRDFIFDVCHNSASCLEFLNSIRTYSKRQNFKKFPAFVSILADKNINQILDKLREVLDPLFLFKVQSSRSLSQENISTRHKDLLPVHRNFTDAWEKNKLNIEKSNQPCVICGSFYGVGEAFRFFSIDLNELGQ